LAQGFGRVVKTLQLASHRVDARDLFLLILAMVAPMLDLTLMVHPSLIMPIQLPPECRSLRVSGSALVVDLMEMVEDMFFQQAIKQGVSKELQINVLWNTKDPKKALSPNSRLDEGFQQGDVFGIYGDIVDFQGDEIIPETQKTPVTILTGFLGAGKTTLLNYILQEQREKKIAIIENEFGEVSIDDTLLKKEKMATAEKILVMDNGCMCCTLRGDLIKGLQQMVDEINSSGNIDAIIIETTGMADPVPIIRTFMSSPQLTDFLRLDGVVTLVDAKNVMKMLDDKDIEEGKVNIAFQQVAFSDKVILNKLDLTTSDEAIKVKDRIREINAFAKILPAVKSRIKLTELSNIRAHDITHFADVTDFGVESAEPNVAGHGSDHGSGHGDGHGDGHDSDHGGHGSGHDGGHGGGHESGHDENSSSGHGELQAGHGDGGSGHGTGHGHANKARHDNRINSFSIIREGEIQPRFLARFFQWASNLPPIHGTVYRIKAILAVKGHPLKHVFHAVMDASDEDDAGPWAEGEKKVNKIVFIGKSLNQKVIRDAFEALFVDEADKKLRRSGSEDDEEMRMHPMFGALTLEELKSRLPSHDCEAIWSKMPKLSSEGKVAKLSSEGSSKEQLPGNTNV